MKKYAAQYINSRATPPANTSTMVFPGILTIAASPIPKLWVLFWSIYIAEAEREDFIHSILVINPNIELCLS